MFLTTFLPIVIAYLIGSINFSYLITIFLKGIDIRNHGSGNAGATNTFRVLGKLPAIVVGVLDAIKGVASLGVGEIMSSSHVVVILCGIAAIIGHNWPIYLKFRGGKGIATTIGITIFLYPIITLIAGIIGILSIFITRYVSVGSILFAFCIPLIFSLKGYSIFEVGFGVVVFLLALLRHKENIIRVIEGTERKI